VALRQGRRDEARELFLEFARLLPEHPYAADALELAAELAAASGDVDLARREFDRLVDGYPRHPRTDFARLNRAILMVRAGQVVDAQPALTEWIARAPFPPLLGRAHAALGAAFLAANQPGEAAKHFAVAQREGMDAFATLGLGGVALAQGRWDEAERRLKEARDIGTPEITAAADYGLAGVAYQRGAVKEFAQTARDILRANPSSAMAPRLLYVLTGLAVEGKDWSNALDTAKALVTQFPDDETADDALERVGAGAAAAAVWPVTYDAYTLLRQRYPASPFVENARLPLAQAQIATGRADQARADLERLVATAPGDTQAWVLLARARELAGDRQGAFDAYARVGREASSGEPVREAMLGQARLLVADKRWDMARGVLDRLIKSDDQALVVEAAYFLGEASRGENDALGAAEYYMTAAYLAPESATGRRALLAAAQSFVALKQPEAAVTLYRKLLAQANVPGDVADAARQGLQALGRREGS
jgi:TolA-binding protein